MAGLLTHLGVSLVGFLIFYFVFYKSTIRWIYGLGFLLGHLGPDLIDFGIVGIMKMTLNPSVIITSRWFYPLKILGHTFMNWVVVGLLVAVVAMVLYKIGKISREKFFIVCIVVVIVLVGALFHLGLDVLIQENSRWI